MIKLKLFIISSLLINTFHIQGCGLYWATGEAIRFSLLKPDFIGLNEYKVFNYCSNYFYGEMEYTVNPIPYTDENIVNWQHFFEYKISKKMLKNLIYTADMKTFKPILKEIKNKIQTKQYQRFLRYITFAKKCSGYNSALLDPWERDEIRIAKNRNQLIQKAIAYAKVETNPILKRRFAYLAMRLCYYNENYTKLSQIYTKYFQLNTQNDCIDYWALHFYLYTVPSSIDKEVKLAKIILNSDEKRFSSFLMHDGSIDSELIYKKARSKEDKAAVLFVRLIQKVDYALPEINQFNALLHNEKCNLFLVTREINKLEDNILTPYYAKFNSSLKGYESENQKVSPSKKDQNTAIELAHWMKKNKPTQKKYQAWWNVMHHYLKFIGNQKLTTSNLHELACEYKSPNENLARFAKIVTCLETIKYNPLSKLKSPLIQSTLMDEAKIKNSTFLFAIARELEYQGNTSEAAFLLAKTNTTYNYENYMYWKSPKLIQTLSVDYFEDYFFYLDAQYSTAQVQNLIQACTKNHQTSKFDLWLKKEIIANKSRIFDLLGTKYLREDQLPQAYESFKQVSTKLWYSKDYPYQTYFTKNPFYRDFYYKKNAANDHSKYTKPQLIKKLIALKNKSTTAERKDRAKIYQQIANCYFNMSYFGHSWLMRRYYWTEEALKNGLPDDHEYFTCALAKKYYKRAYTAATNPKAKALMLRMLDITEQLTSGSLHFDKQLKKEFPKDYEPLVSDCSSYFAYAKALH